jgi:protein-tyrosine phosphatase
LIEAPHIDVDGVRNFREVVVDATPHGSLRRNRLFRSGTLVGITDAGRATIAELGITDVVDLRSHLDMGGNAEPDVGLSVRIHAVPVCTDPTGSHPVGAAIRSRDRDRLNEVIVDRTSVIDWMRQGYARLAVEETESFARVLRVVADANGGVVVNCAAGKDRTGWAVAVTLLAVGAGVDTVADEFLLSNAGPPPGEVDPAMADLMAPLTGVRAEYLQAGLDAITTRWSSIDHYLEDALDVDDELRDRLVTALVERPPTP